VNDLGLLDRARRGDESAFAELLERHRAAVFRYASHMCGRSAAEDVVQEVFLAFLRQLGRYDAGRGALQAYLLGIGRRQALKCLTGRQREDWPEQGRDSAANPLDTPAVPDRVIDPFLASSEAEIVARVRSAIAILPPIYREAIVLCDLNELDYATAASVMGCPIGTVRSRLSSDPRTGDVEYRLTNLVRGEPPRRLFEIPSDDHIVDVAPPQ
jgi:RNA polymerase sigma-70 factor, ECF subfamily